MNMFYIAYKNILRRKVRTFLTIAGVAVAVAMLASLLGFGVGYKKAIDKDVERMGYEAIVTAKGCPYEAATLMLKGGGGIRYMDESIYSRIIGDSAVSKVTPSLMKVVFDPNKGEKGGFSSYLGIDASSYISLKPYLKFKSGGLFSSGDAFEAILGYEAAELEQRSVGDKIFIPGINQIFTVAGIFERTGTQEDGTIFLPLETTQKLFSLKGQITALGIKLKDINGLNAFEERMYKIAEIQVVDMSQVKSTILGLINSARSGIMAVILIAIIVSLLGAVNTTLTAVYERKKEIGIMKAIGASRNDIFFLICLETLETCFIGGMAGVVLTLAGSQLVEILIRKVMPYVPTGRIIDIGPVLIIECLLTVVILGVVAGLYPAWQASSQKPMEAIRNE